MNLTNALVIGQVTSRYDHLFPNTTTTSAASFDASTLEAIFTKPPKPMRVLVDEIIGFSVLAVFTFLIIAVIVLCLWANGKCYKRNKKASRCCPHIDSPASSIIFSFHQDDQMLEDRMLEDPLLEVAEPSTQMSPSPRPRMMTNSSLKASNKVVVKQPAAPVQRKPSVVIAGALKLMARRHTDQPTSLSEGDHPRSSSGSSEDMAQATFGIDSLSRKQEYAKFIKERYLRLTSHQHSSSGAINVTPVDQPIVLGGSSQNSASKLNAEALATMQICQDEQPSTSQGLCPSASSNALQRHQFLQQLSESIPTNSQSVRVGRFTIRPSVGSLFTPPPPVLSISQPPSTQSMAKRLTSQPNRQSSEPNEDIGRSTSLKES